VYVFYICSAASDMIIAAGLLNSHVCKRVTQIQGCFSVTARTQHYNFPFSLIFTLVDICVLF